MTADVEEGRYVYCVVDCGDGDSAGLQVDGVDGGRVGLVRAGSVGAVVQPVDSLFDTDDEGTLTRWFLEHQRVVDAAGERFGTPLPFRFDTILRGNDGRVSQWLDAERDALRDHLDGLEGHWEYRITVESSEAPTAEATDDDRLCDLRDRRETAGEGTSFLLEKQYERRLSELRREAHARRADDLREQLTSVTREVEAVGADGPSLDLADRDHDGPATKFAVLCPASAESSVGELLDDVASEDGVEVTFTGPWPPYSFTPAFGGDEGGADAGR